MILVPEEERSVKSQDEHVKSIILRTFKTPSIIIQYWLFDSEVFGRLAFCHTISIAISDGSMYTILAHLHGAHDHWFLEKMSRPLIAKKYRVWTPRLDRHPRNTKIPTRKNVRCILYHKRLAQEVLESYVAQRECIKMRRLGIFRHL